jgi:hypothetical protein
MTTTPNYAGFSLLFEPQHLFPHSFPALPWQHDAVFSVPDPSLQQSAVHFPSFMHALASFSPQQEAPSLPAQQEAISLPSLWRMHAAPPSFAPCAIFWQQVGFPFSAGEGF